MSSQNSPDLRRNAALPWLLVLAWGLLGWACRPDTYRGGLNVALGYETDTLLFDTVLVRAGSVTKRFKVYNPSNQDLLVDRIALGSALAGGNRLSGFRLNINGLPTNQAQNLRLAAGDSLYIFAEVTVNPNDSLTPYLVTDSVLFFTGQQVGKVMLTAFDHRLPIERKAEA